MKLSCLQENLHKGTVIAGRAVASRSTLPVLSNVLLSATEAGLSLAGTNLEMGIQARLAAKVAEPGAVTLPARLLADFVNSLPPEQVDIELNDKTQTAHLSCGRFEANIKGIDAQEFPVLPAWDEKATTATIEGKALRRMVDLVTFAAASDASRPILTGCLVSLRDGKLTMAAADGFRLSVLSQAIDAEVGPVEVIVPARALNEIARIVEDDDEVGVAITTGRNQILFNAPAVDLVSQLVEGRFPDYRQIIPAQHSTRLTIDRGALLHAVSVARLFAGADIVRLAVRGEVGIEGCPDGSLGLSAVHAEIGDNDSLLPAVIKGEPVDIAFNAKYLIDVLAAMDGARVALELSASSSPGVIRPAEGDEEYLHVIMPMHVEGLGK